MHACMHASNVGRGHRVGVDWIIPRCLKIEIPISVGRNSRLLSLDIPK